MGRKRKLNLVKWEDITKRKIDGVLGVKKPLQQILALLAKWWWRFYEDKDSLWVRVIKRKYKIGTNYWVPPSVVAGAVSTTWRDICVVGDPNSMFGSLLQHGFTIQVNSGNQTSF